MMEGPAASSARHDVTDCGFVPRLHGSRNLGANRTRRRARHPISHSVSAPMFAARLTSYSGGMAPVHPDLVHFPIALLTVAFAADVIGFVGRRPAVRSFGWVCLVLAFLGLLGAAVTGWIDMNRASLRHETHELVDLHWRVGVVLTVLTLALLSWRGWLRRRLEPGRSGWFLLCYTAVFALMVFQGWFGGELAYAHGAGVAATGQGMVPPADAAHRLQPAADLLRKIPGFAEEPGRTAGESSERDR
jgi:uncharacterized membrane protein